MVRPGRNYRFDLYFGNNGDGDKRIIKAGQGGRTKRMLCRLLRRLQPDLSSAAFIIVRSSTLFPPAVVPYCQPSPAAVLSITFATPVDGWLLRSPPTQQQTN